MLTASFKCTKLSIVKYSLLKHEKRCAGVNQKKGEEVYFRPTSTTGKKDIL